MGKQCKGILIVVASPSCNGSFSGNDVIKTDILPNYALIVIMCLFINLVHEYQRRKGVHLLIVIHALQKSVQPLPVLAFHSNVIPKRQQCLFKTLGSGLHSLHILGSLILPQTWLRAWQQVGRHAGPADNSAMHGRLCPDPFRMRDAKGCKVLKAFNYRLIYLELGRKIRVASLREHVVFLFLRWRKDTVIHKAVALNVPNLGLRILLVVAALEKCSIPRGPVVW